MPPGKPANDSTPEGGDEDDDVVIDKLLLAGRMAAVGGLAAGVAHEINNPLAFVMGNISYVEEQIELALAEGQPLAPSTGSELLRALSEAMEGGRRIQAIVRDLKAFSAPDQSVGRVAVSIGDVVDAALRIVGNEVRHRARLVCEYEAAPPAFADEGRLGQVLVHVLLNAAQALPDGRPDGEVRVSARGEGERVIVEISDNGTGIPAEVLPRVFDPFFTTRPVGSGTGMGLSVCRGLMASMDGGIAIESTVGRGTLVRLWLPRSSAVPVIVPPARPAVVGRKRILIIDDEPMVGGTIRRMLHRAHDVEVLPSATEALDLIRSGARYDVILCDLMMPGMSGVDLHEELERFAPAQAARTGFLTGGAFTPRSKSFLARMRARTIDKPFDVEQVLALVERMMGDG